MKILAIIQARTQSTRLPNKVLMKIKEKTILEHIVDFLSYSKFIDEIVIATTQLSSDDKIESLSKKMGISCYRGSSSDVLERFYKCAKLHRADLIVRITGDDPLIDPLIVDEIIDKSISSKSDYCSNIIKKTFPLGFTSCEVFTFQLLKLLNETNHDPQSREHVTYFVRNNLDHFKTTNFSAPTNLSRPNWRLTIDYPDDFKLIEGIFSNLYENKNYISYKKLVNFLDKNPQILKLNQKYQ